MVDPLTSTLTSRQQSFLAQYQALTTANAAAQLQVARLEKLGGVNQEKPYGNFDAAGRQLCDQAKQKPIEIHENFVKAAACSNTRASWNLAGSPPQI